MTVRVKLWGSLRSLAGDREVIELDAGSIRGVLEAIRRDYPGLNGQLDRGVSFAIDGAIHRDAQFIELSGDEEIVMMPRMVGG